MKKNFSTINDYTSFLKSLQFHKQTLNEAGFEISQTATLNTLPKVENFKGFNKIYKAFNGKTTLNQNVILSSLISKALESTEPQNAFFYCMAFYSAELGVSYSTIKRTINRLLELQILVKCGELSAEVAGQTRIINAFCFNAEILEIWLSSGLSFSTYYKGIFGKEPKKKDNKEKEIIAEFTLENDSKEASELEIEIKALRDEVEIRDEKLAELQNKNEVLKQNAAIFEKDLLTSLELQKRLNAENEYLKEELKRLSADESQTINDDLKESNALLESTTQSLVKENDALKAEIAELNKKLETARTAFKEKNDIIKNLQAQNGGANSAEYEARLKGIQELQKAEITQLKAEIASLKNSNQSEGINFITLPQFVEKELAIFERQCNPKQKDVIYKAAMDLAISLSGGKEPAPKLETSESLQPALFPTNEKNARVEKKPKAQPQPQLIINELPF